MRKQTNFIKVLFLSILLFTIFPLKEASASSSTITGYQIVEYAKKFMGVPYVFGGTTPRGFDCSGYIAYVYKNNGVSMSRTTGSQYNQGRAVSRSQLMPGDLVFFANTYKRGISHVGIYVGDNKFINAESKGVAISSLNSSYWGSKYAGAKRVLTNPVGSLFKDISDAHPAFNAIKELNEQGIIKGYENNLYRPGQNVTRGQAAAIINRVLQLEVPGSTSFKDVPSSNPFFADIAAIENVGIINGYSDGTFRPYETLTRAQMAVIVTRAFEQNIASTASQSGPVYKDVSPSYWAYDEIAALYHIDKTSMYRTSQYRATDHTTRAEFAAAIYNAK